MITTETPQVFVEYDGDDHNLTFAVYVPGEKGLPVQHPVNNLDDVDTQLAACGFTRTTGWNASGNSSKGIELEADLTPVTDEHDTTIETSDERGILTDVIGSTPEEVTGEIIGLRRAIDWSVVLLQEGRTDEAYSHLRASIGRP